MLHAASGSSPLWDPSVSQQLRDGIFTRLFRTVMRMQVRDEEGVQIRTTHPVARAESSKSCPSKAPVPARRSRRASSDELSYVLALESR